MVADLIWRLYSAEVWWDLCNAQVDGSSGFGQCGIRSEDVFVALGSTMWVGCVRSICAGMC